MKGLGEGVGEGKGENEGEGEGEGEGESARTHHPLSANSPPIYPLGRPDGSCPDSV